MSLEHDYKILVMHLDGGHGEVRRFGDKKTLMGGSHLAAALFLEYGLPHEPWNDPRQPLIFAIGPLTGYFPLMSKVVCGFKSPYHDQYAESHAGGRMALSMRFAGYDAVVFIGRAPTLSCAVVGGRNLDLKDVHYLKGADVFRTGRLIRKIVPGSGGHRSIARIGVGGERGSAYGCINVDTYRHFGRLGAGSVMGAKNLKAIVVQGDNSAALPEGKEYRKLFDEIYKAMTATDMMSKYHDLGTPGNVIPLNELKSLPWRNLQATSDPGAPGISGERFAADLLLRNTACSGCPVGCIHVGMLREQFAAESQYMYRQVSYDHEPIFAMGSMLGITEAKGVLALLDECEKAGLDVMSAGVSLAWATEALAKGLVSEKDTGVALHFGEPEGYKQAIALLGEQEGEFWQALAQGALRAAKEYGGQEFACVLGQEMAGYATGETFFASQALSFRHSHLDNGAYSFDQTDKAKDPAKSVEFILKDEKGRCLLTSMVACLFSRKVYSDANVARCLEVLGFGEAAASLDTLASDCQRLRWRLKLATGYDPDAVQIPKRFLEIETWKGKMDPVYLQAVRERYSAEIRRLGAAEAGER